MGFNEAARLTIEALRDGRFQHEPRSLASGKNLLATGDVSVDDVIAMIRRCPASRHTRTPHHLDPSQDVDIFLSRVGGVRWYVKSYLVESDEMSAIFISVHPSDFR